MTQAEVAKCLTIITAAYPNLTLTEATIVIWADLLDDIPFDLGRKAIKRVLQRQTGTWWPAVGTVRQEALSLVRPGMPGVDEAWRQVTHAIRRYGYMQPEEARNACDSAVSRMIDVIGWQSLCEGDPDVTRGQFIRLYQAAQSREIQDVHDHFGALGSADSYALPHVVSEWMQDFGKKPVPS